MDMHDARSSHSLSLSCASRDGGILKPRTFFGVGEVEVYIIYILCVCVLCGSWCVISSTLHAVFAYSFMRKD